MKFTEYGSKLNIQNYVLSPLQYFN